ncbi:MAG: group I intron-associated PD-(D/E)XK endonuclease [candidate division WOR-3 bacterium]
MVKLTQTIGKEGELRVIGELLRRGFDVYLPAVDVGGIDCIIKTSKGYKEIQIKTRSEAKLLLFDVKEFTPRDNFFIICHNLKEPDIFWVIPSKVFKENAQYLKKYRRYRLILGDEDSKMRRKLHSFRNNFFQLKERESEIKISKKDKKEKKSGWQKLKELYPTVEAVEKKIQEAKEKRRSKEYIKVLENLKKYWQKHKKL